MSACTLVGSITQLLASILKDKSDVLNYMEVFTRLEGIIRTQSRVQHIVMMRTEMKQLFIWSQVHQLKGFSSEFLLTWTLPQELILTVLG